jgi:glycerol-3-phosphate dehydrogenase
VARVRELFGPDADDVFRRWEAEPESCEPLGPDFGHGSAEVERAAHEMVETLEDLVHRRLSSLPGGVPVDRPTLERVAGAAARITGWDEARRRAEVDRFRASRWSVPLDGGDQSSVSDPVES